MANTTTGLEGSNALVGRHEIDGEDLQHFSAPVGAGVLAGTPCAIGHCVGVTLEAADSSGLATLDSDRKRWAFDVKNVTSYNASTGAEATWEALTFGCLIYVDAAHNVTTSPKDASGNTNAIFGTCVSTSLSGVSTKNTETLCAILVADYR